MKNKNINLFFYTLPVMQHASSPHTPAAAPPSAPPPAPPPAPPAAPPAPETAETRDIVRRFRSRREIYPNLNTVEDLDRTDYNGLVEPLERNPNNLHSQQEDFLKKTKEAESFIAVGLRNQSITNITNVKIRSYLNDIYKSANTEEVEQKMGTSTVIREALITAEMRMKIKQHFDAYLKYREQLKRQIGLIVLLNKQRENIASSPQQYARSGEKFMAEKVQGLRENWAGMDGKEKFISGAVVLVGLSWFLNSNNTGISEMRDVLKKVLFVGAGLFAANTTTRLFTGRSGTELFNSYTEDRSGKRNFLKDSFDTDKHGAEIMNSALVVLERHDFMEVADAYLKQEARYRQEPVPEDQRELPIGGVAQDQMHPRQIYIAMRLLSRKLEKEGSSLEQIVNAFKKEEEKAKAENRPFTRPTFGLIVAAVLQKDILRHRIEGERIIVSQTESIEAQFTDNQRSAMSNWWMDTGKPEDWKKQHYSPGTFPISAFSAANAQHIASNAMEINKPISGVITQQYFGRYTAGFNNLYDLKMKNAPADKIHMLEDNLDKAEYISSRVPVDYESFRTQSREYARVAAVRSAYDEALKKIKEKYRNNDKFRGIERRLHEFVQPVFGVFLAESAPGRMGPIKEYVMFLRLVLPDNIEFDLRKNKEWPDGDMIKMMNEKPLAVGEKLTRAEFQTLSEQLVRTDIRTRFPDLNITTSFLSVYGGAYECFLANMRLHKNDTAKIDRALEHFSNKFAGKSLTKVGILRYLASHNFTEAEIREALGMGANEIIPNQGIELTQMVNAKTQEAETELNNAIQRQEQSVNAMPNTIIAAQIAARTMAQTELNKLKNNKEGWDLIIRAGFDKFFIAILNGDPRAMQVARDKLLTPQESFALMGLLPILVTPDTAAKTILLQNQILPLYKNYIVEAGGNKDKLKKIMEAVEEFRKLV